MKEKDSESKVPIVTTRKGSFSRDPTRYSSEDFRNKRTNTMDQSSSKTSTSTQDGEFDVYKHPEYVDLLKQQNHEAKGIKFTNDLAGAQRENSLNTISKQIGKL